MNFGLAKKKINEFWETMKILSKAGLTPSIIYRGFSKQEWCKEETNLGLLVIIEYIMQAHYTPLVNQSINKQTNKGKKNKQASGKNGISTLKNP